MKRIQTHTHGNWKRIHPAKKAKFAHIQIGWTHMHYAGYVYMINCPGFICIHTDRHTLTHTLILDSKAHDGTSVVS